MPTPLGGLVVRDDGTTLEEALLPLQDLYRRVDEHAAALAEPLDLPCGPGCSACCRQSVFVTPLEALALLHHAQTHFTAAQRETLLQRGLAIFHAHQPLILSFGHPPCPGLPALPGAEPAPGDPVERARGLNFDCPFLDHGGRCTAYPARDLRGRLFGVSRLRSRDEYYACPHLGAHLDGKEVRLMDAEAVHAILRLHPCTTGEQVIPYYLWRYAPLL
jgi:hypothetical protein